MKHTCSVQYHPSDWLVGGYIAIYSPSGGYITIHGDTFSKIDTDLIAYKDLYAYILSIFALGKKDKHTRNFTYSEMVELMHYAWLTDGHVENGKGKTIGSPLTQYKHY